MGVILSDDKSFCCNGCLTVYEILKENNLVQYYELEKNPGNTLWKSEIKHYSFLNNPEIASVFILYESENLVRVKFRVPSIHCSSCIWLLENLDQIEKGILHAEVNFSSKYLTLDYDPNEISLGKLASFLDSFGYKPEVNLDTTSAKSVSTYQKETLLKLGIAGFAFGNIMLFSFPDYFGFFVEKEFSRYFGWLCLLLSIPTVVYSASSYFISAWEGMKGNFLTIDVPIAIGIIALFMRSSWEVIFSSGTGFFDSLSGLIFFLLIGKWFQEKTYRSLSFDRDYKSYFPLGVTKISDKKEDFILVYELKRGDKIRIRNKEIIPADSELLSNEARIDYSFVTGETDPVIIKKGKKIFAGGRLLGKAIELTILKEASQSYLTQLWNKEGSNDDNWNSLTNTVAKYFTVIILFIASITLFYWLMIDPFHAVSSFTAVLIIACPCALALAAPFALSTSMTIMGRNGLYLRNTLIAEKLAHLDHIVFDKTGTLTTIADTPEFNGTLKKEELIKIRVLASHSTHPVSRAIKSIFSGDHKPYRVKEFKEIEGKGIQGFVDGQLVKLGSDAFLGVINGLNNNNLSRVYVSIDGNLKGFLNVPSRFRTDLQELAHELSENYQLDIVSGDNEVDRPTLEAIFPSGSAIVFRQSPTDKMEFIEKIKKRQKKVAMIGDGLNDAGALTKSDVGIAITDDISSFTPSSHAIMMGQKLRLLPSFLKLAKSTRRIVIGSFIISFLYNIGGLSFAVTGLLSPLVAAILMPVSSLTVVAFSTFMVRLEAKKLKLL